MEQLEEVEDVQVSYHIGHLPLGIYKAIFECVFLCVHEKEKKTLELVTLFPYLSLSLANNRLSFLNIMDLLSSPILVK